MRTYTAEQVCEAVRGFAGYSHVHHGIGAELLDIATDYAALLRERESAKVVTDEMVECACDGFMRVRGIGMHLAWQSMTEETRISYRNAMRPALKAVAPMLARDSSEELKEWEQFGREIEKRLRYNPWGFKGSYPEIIDQIIRVASARVPEECDGVNVPSWVSKLSDPATYAAGWNACRAAMLTAAPKPEKE